MTNGKDSPQSTGESGANQDHPAIVRIVLHPETRKRLARLQRLAAEGIGLTGDLTADEVIEGLLHWTDADAFAQAYPAIQQQLIALDDDELGRE